MILLVDAGNSRVKWRVQQAGQCLGAGNVPTAQADALRQAWAPLRPVEALVCCVAGASARQRIAEALPVAPDAVRWLAAEATGHGVVNHYRPPESLGADRYAALVATRRGLAGAWVVVGVGTALTADMLGAEGDFLGGCICPGPELMRDALSQGAAGLAGVQEAPDVDGTHAPLDTGAAVTQGIGLALAGVVAGMCERLARQSAQAPGILLFGGARRALRPFLSGHVEEREDWVLEGLAWIARDLGFDA